MRASAVISRFSADMHVRYVELKPLKPPGPPGPTILRCVLVGITRAHFAYGLFGQTNSPIVMRAMLSTENVHADT
jgi:hypothetical protein